MKSSDLQNTYPRTDNKTDLETPSKRKIAIFVSTITKLLNHNWISSRLYKRLPL